MCCFSQLSLLTEQLRNLIRIDPFTVLPHEVCLKILAYLDATSLCRATQVSKHWRSLAEDDILWLGICQQHIGQKCLKCGWGLPILKRRRQVHPGSVPLKRSLEATLPSVDRRLKRQRSEGYPYSLGPSTGPSPSHVSAPASPIPSSSFLAPDPLISSVITEASTRPWKDVYRERLTVERNWRRGRCFVRTLRGHTNGVMCLQFSETLQHPSFPILITGSYDRTVRVWDLETGQELRCLRGHTRAIRALQFDEAKLVTGSMDHTIRVWNWRKGECVRILEGHTDGVVCLTYEGNILASGSVDMTVKIWNFDTSEAFTLRGHTEWVNAVKFWDAHGSTSSPPDPCQSTFKIETGKMLFSASDDGTIRLWDLARKTCVREFIGHVGQVQSLRILDVDDEDEDDCSRSSDVMLVAENSSLDDVQIYQQSNPADICTVVTHDARKPKEGADDKGGVSRSARHLTPDGKHAQKPVLISGCLDNTIKVWDVETGKVIRTLFGHIEGVWAVACDKLRLVSGSHDRTIKVSRACCAWVDPCRAYD